MCDVWESDLRFTNFDLRFTNEGIVGRCSMADDRWLLAVVRFPLPATCHAGEGGIPNSDCRFTNNLPAVVPSFDCRFTIADLQDVRNTIYDVRCTLRRLTIDFPFSLTGIN